MSICVHVFMEVVPLNISCKITAESMVLKYQGVRFRREGVLSSFLGVLLSAPEICIRNSCVGTLGREMTAFTK